MVAIICLLLAVLESAGVLCRQLLKSVWRNLDEIWVDSQSGSLLLDLLHGFNVYIPYLLLDQRLLGLFGLLRSLLKFAGVAWTSCRSAS